MDHPSPPSPHRGVVASIQGALASLPPAERRLADQLLDDPGAFARRSIGEIATQGETSTTTVLRFYSRLGFERFKDFRQALTEEALRFRIATTDSQITAADIERGDSLEEVVAKIARDEKLSIDETAAVLDTSELGRAVQLVAAARRIDIFGLGASATVGSDLQQKLSRIGRTALQWSDHHSAWTAAATLGEGAVAVAISYSGRTWETVDFLSLARRSGAQTVAVTNVAESPVCEQADIALLTAARESTFRSGALSSRIAQLMVIDALYIGVVHAGYDKAAQALHASHDAVNLQAGRFPSNNS